MGNKTGGGRRKDKPALLGKETGTTVEEESRGVPTLPLLHLATHVPSEAAPPPGPVSAREHKNSSVSVRGRTNIDVLCACVCVSVCLCEKDKKSNWAIQKILQRQTLFSSQRRSSQLSGLEA